MKIIICLDERQGIRFNHRRQSKDRRVIEDIGTDLDGTLYIEPYSKALFLESGIAYVCKEKPWETLGEQGVCFVESAEFLHCLSSVSQITVYWWNRHYPSDLRLDLDFNSSGFCLSEHVDFAGFSHEKITKEVYKR